MEIEKKEIHNASDISLIMENNDNFDWMVIKTDNKMIDNISWIDPDYANKLLKLDIYESVTVNSKTFIELMAKHLEIEKYNIENMSISNDIIGEEPNYLYELYYVDLKEHKKHHLKDNLNTMANLLNTNGDTIYSNAIVFKNYLPSLSDSMTLATVTKQDISKLLHHRVYTKIVTFDDEWKEQEIAGDLNLFATKFFDEEKFKKYETGFLLHNVNIWYTVDYGEMNVCGKLIKEPIERCIIFTMKSDEYRGNITLTEVKKIIHLSNILNCYNPLKEHTEERIDKFGRKIINNKYKVLDSMYNAVSK